MLGQLPSLRHFWLASVIGAAMSMCYRCAGGWGMRNGRPPPEWDAGWGEGRRGGGPRAAPARRRSARLQLDPPRRHRSSSILYPLSIRSTISIAISSASIPDAQWGSGTVGGLDAGSASDKA